MRRLLLLALVPSVVLAAPARKPVVAVLPVKASSPELSRLGLLLEARATMLLVSAGQHATLDMKQVLAMAGQEGLEPSQLSDDDAADRALALLGADRVVAVTLSGDASGLTVSGSVRDGKAPAPFSVKVPGGWAAALTQGSEAVAKAALEKDGAALAAGAAAQPESKSDAALKSLGACWETALKQPLGIDAPVGLSGRELDDAVASCRAALKADPSLRYAQATLALLLAIAREDAEAEKLLGPASDTDAALMPWALSRFWLATRHQSNEAAVKFLAGVLAKHPGVLVLRSFHANTLAAMNEHAKAAAAWNEYLALAPASAFAQGRLSRSLARQDKHADALAAAKKGLALAPDSREARVVLAARQLDAGKLNDARVTLQPLMAQANAPADALVQLGFAYLSANDAKAAAPLFQSAAERAAGARGQRTRGRALYGLAVCEAKQKHADAAKAAYAKSRETGYAVAAVDPALADLVQDAAGGAEAGAASGGLYIDLEPGTAPSAEASALAEKTLRAKLDAFGAHLAPDQEDPKAAVSLLKAKQLKGYQLRVHLLPSETGAGFKVEMLVLSYPEQALKGTWSVKASGGKPEKVIPLLVNKVVDDAAGDLDWKN